MIEEFSRALIIEVVKARDVKITIVSIAQAAMTKLRRNGVFILDILLNIRINDNYRLFYYKRNSAAIKSMATET
jgi:hypothetical protein